MCGWMAARAAYWTPLTVVEAMSGPAPGIAQHRSPSLIIDLPVADDEGLSPSAAFVGSAARFPRTGARLVMVRLAARPVMASPVRMSDPGAASETQIFPSRPTVPTTPDVRTPPAPVPQRLARARWHADSWLSLRSGQGLSAAAGRGTYGGSQAGGTVRYWLDQQGSSQLYLRATKALSGTRETEGAVGIGVRPAMALPVRLMAEARASRFGGETFLRPAALLVTEIPPIALPAGLTGEVYGQAGYVGGRFATPFADGQARVTRPVAAEGPLRIELGAGAWGGAQKGAQRLDVGPTATLALTSGPAPIRLAIDYRWRVAGDAAPGSGPALTLSTGF